jgi:hypothetical protein
MVHIDRILSSMARGCGTSTPALFLIMPMVPPVYKTRTWNLKHFAAPSLDCCDWIKQLFKQLLFKMFGTARAEDL